MIREGHSSSAWGQSCAQKQPIRKLRQDILLGPAELRISLYGPQYNNYWGNPYFKGLMTERLC